MKEQKYYLAIDLGASSGRHIVGSKNEDGTIFTDEVYRFPNKVIESDSDLIWDLKHILSEVKNGIRRALEKYPKIESLAIDTWGVDYVLMDGDKEILPTYSYRSKRTEKAITQVHSLIDFEHLYQITGTQFQPFNTIYQLYADKICGRLENASSLLMIPDYLVFKLTNVLVQEYTNLSTTGLLDLSSQEISSTIMNKIGVTKNLFNAVQKPGYIVGPLTEEVRQEVGGNINVVLVASHDTASAVEGIPTIEDDPYLSSGTWSLLGIKKSQGITSRLARVSNFTNEAGPTYIRFQKNIMGLWIINCLSKELGMNHQKMRELARLSDYKCLFDVNDSCFLSPPNMKNAILDYLKNQQLPPPKDDTDLLNACYHSLAHSYKVALDELEKITGTTYQKIYIVGGGAHNDYLNELTANMSKKQVIALPIEATALGNLKLQMENTINE